MSLNIDAATTDAIRRTANLPANTAMTMCGWFKRDSNTGAYQQHLLLAFDSAPDLLTTIQVSSGNNVVLNSSIAQVTVQTTPPVGEWYFLAITCNGTTMVGYYAQYGAASLTSNSQACDTFTPSEMTAGNYITGTNSNFDGNLQHIRAWDAVLSAAELLLEMYSSLPVRTANLNTAMRDISASSVTDLSSNARDWTVAGTLALSDNPPVDDLLFVPAYGFYTAAAGGSGLLHRRRGN